jgi:hypothetical protein
MKPTAVPLTRDELALERAAFMARRQGHSEEAIAKVRALHAAYKANPTHPVRLSDPRSYIELICERCQTEFYQRRRQGRPNRYCNKCRWVGK